MTHSLESLSSTIRYIISKKLNIAEDILSSDTEISSLPNVDSMRVLEIILETEKKYGIEIPDAVTFNIKTIGEFEKLVEDLVEQI